jgi:uncharacterized protein (DUF58 family)
VATTSEAAPSTELTVYPRVEAVTAPPKTTGHDPRSGGGHPTFLGSGDEFYGLRGYEVGDDLRRVHWPSTARQDELMIRQHEVPWQGRTAVLLDVRQSVHSESSFEDAVSAAASLVNACWKRESQVRFLTTDGLDSAYGGGPAHLSAIMEHLAVVEPGTGRLEAVAGTLRQRATGALVLVTTTAGVAGLERTAASASYGWAAVVAFGPRGGGQAPAGPARLVVTVEPGQSFAEAWNGAMALTPAGSGARR